MTDNLDLAKKFYQAWNEKDFATVRSLVADDYHFKGSIDEFHSADEAFAAFEKIAPLINGIELTSIFGSGDQVAAYYIFACAQPVGNVPTAELLTFKDGKVVDSRIFYDARSFAGAMELPPVKDTM